MGYPRISIDRKELVIQKVFLNKSIANIAKECHISRTSVIKIKKLYREYGVLENPNRIKTGRPRKITKEGVMVSNIHYDNKHYNTFYIITYFFIKLSL